MKQFLSSCMGEDARAYIAFANGPKAGSGNR